MLEKKDFLLFWPFYLQLCAKRFNKQNVLSHVHN